MTKVLEVYANEIWVEIADASGDRKLFAIDLRGADAATRAVDATVRFSRPDRSRTAYLRSGKDDAMISAAIDVAATEIAAYVSAFLTLNPLGGEDERFYASGPGIRWEN